MSIQPTKQDIFKIILLGDVGTGKTSFITQLIHRVPERLPKSSSHLSFFTMKVSKPFSILQVWDSPGDSKYQYQVLGLISKFNVILIFVDITNQYTYDRARIICQQLDPNIISNGIQVHMIESKKSVTTKDPMKRKVSYKKLRKIIDKYDGGIFQYSQTENIQSIIQQILEWKSRKQKTLSLQRQREREEDLKQIPEINFVSETQNPNCQCQIC